MNARQHIGQKLGRKKHFFYPGLVIADHTTAGLKR